MTESKHLVLDLFSGSKAASASAAAYGYDVVSVDIDPQTQPSITTDISSWQWPGKRPIFVWASPPCQEFSRHDLPWTRKRNPPRPDLSLLLATLRIIRETAPFFWIIENVRGAIPFFRPLLGPHTYAAQPFYLWGRFPRLPRLSFRGCKGKGCSHNAVARASIPRSLSHAIFDSIKTAERLWCIPQQAGPQD